MRYTKIVVAAACMLSSSPAWAQGADETRGSKDDASHGTDEKDIVVTGSLIRGLPREYIASPVFTYDKSDVVRSGSN